MIYPMVEVLKLLAEADAKFLDVCKTVSCESVRSLTFPIPGSDLHVDITGGDEEESEEKYVCIACPEFDDVRISTYFTKEFSVLRSVIVRSGAFGQAILRTDAKVNENLLHMIDDLEKWYLSNTTLIAQHEGQVETTHKQIIEFLFKLNNGDEDIIAAIRDIWYGMLRNIKLPNGVLDIIKEEEGTVVRFKHDYAVEFGIASGTNDTLVLPYDLKVTQNGISVFNFACSFVNAAAEIQGLELDLAAELEGKEPAKKTVKIKTQRFKTAVDLRKTYQANEAKRKAAEQRQVLVDAEVLRITESLHGDAVLGIKKPMKLTQKPSIRTYVIEKLRELKYTVTNNVVTWWETDDHHVN